MHEVSFNRVITGHANFNKPPFDVNFTGNQAFISIASWANREHFHLLREQLVYKTTIEELFIIIDKNNTNSIVPWYLSQLTHLRRLELSNVVDPCLMLALSEQKLLSSLTLSGCQIRDADLPNLYSLVNLEHLDLSREYISIEAFTQLLDKLPKLESVPASFYFYES
ncbi:MAG: hypothetical protein JSR58_05975 [Verrucomicrobia bacterium]|nr:hypothetical protein [Verrucomicrobiota bacterium]